MNLRGKLLIGINKIILVKIHPTYKLFEICTSNRKIKFLNIKERTNVKRKTINVRIDVINPTIYFSKSNLFIYR